jgi:single-stranded DNA-binding protein
MSKATTTIEGFVSQTPELRTTTSGKRVVAISIPHQRQKKTDQGYENIGDTTWAEATFWDAEADLIASQVQKGTAVIVTGDPEVQPYLKNDGTPGAKVILRFPTLGIVPRVPKQQAASQQQGGYQAAGADAWASDPNTPF